MKWPAAGFSKDARRWLRQYLKSADLAQQLERRVCELVPAAIDPASESSPASRKATTTEAAKVEKAAVALLDLLHKLKSQRWPNLLATATELQQFAQGAEPAPDMMQEFGAPYWAETLQRLQTLQMVAQYLRQTSPPDGRLMDADTYLFGSELRRHLIAAGVTDSHGAGSIMVKVFDCVLGQLGSDRRSAEAFVKALDAWPVGEFMDAGFSAFVLQASGAAVVDLSATPPGKLKL